MAIKAKNIRSRLRSLHKKINKFDHESPNRDLDIENLDKKMALLLRHMSRLIGIGDITIDQMSENAIKGLREIKNRMRQHKSIPVTLSNKTVSSEPENDVDGNRTKIIDGKTFLGKRKRATSSSHVSQESHDMRGKEAKISRSEDKSDEERIVIEVRKTSEEEQEAIEVAMAQRDQWLWYDPSEDFDEDMLP